MNTEYFKLVILILILCFPLVGCSGNAGNVNALNAANGSSANTTAAGNTAQDPAAKIEYPQRVVDEFLRSCQAAGSDAGFCACILDKIQRKYSLEEFSVIELKISAGTPPEEFVEFSGRARAQCMK